MDTEELYANLEKAHAAGDTAAAQKFADAIRAEQAKQPRDAIGSVPVHPFEAAADAASGWSPSTWFQSKDPKETSLEEAAGKIGGGAAAGAAGGAVLPGALKAAGKLVPGAAGKLLKGLGEGMGALPLKERMTKGAGGGAAMGAIEGLGEALGAPPALTAGASLLGSGIGESAASFLTKETGQMLKFVGNMSYGNVAGASRAFSGMLSPNRQLNEATARKLQKQLFGERTEGYVNGLVGSENRMAAQEAMRKADPSLLAGPRAAAAGPRAPWETSTGEMGSMGRQSMGRDLAAATGQRTPPGGFAAPAEPALLAGQGTAAGAAGNPLAQAIPLGGAGAAAAGTGAPAKQASAGFAAGKAGAKAKLTAQQQAAEAAETEAARLALRPASEIYRDRMFQGVTAGVKSGKSFSTTPEFGAFQKELEHQVTMGNLPKAKAAELLRQLRLDRAKGSGNSRVLEGYAELVDNQIRKFGKPAEGAVATGADAIDKQVAAGIRESLQKSYNTYTQRLGLGNAEKQYRAAYSAEMLAEAKDKLPHFLYKGFGQEREFAKLARNLARDPQGKPFIQKVLAKHLANQEPKAVATEFERLQSTLVNAGLLLPAELKPLRTGAELVRKTADKGLQQKRADTLKHLLLMAMTRQAGIAGGGAAARPAEVEEEQ